MARVLIVGCGARGRRLGAVLGERGWAVRGTSRTAEGAAEIERAGLEAAIADPDRVGSVVDLLGDVTVLVLLLGSVDDGEALHRERLPSLLEKLVDTPVRGLVYEAAGSVANDALADGCAAVEDANRRWRIPVICTGTDPSARDRWQAELLGAVEGVIGAGAEPG